MNINDITITSLETINAFDIVTGAYKFTLDELQNATIAQTHYYPNNRRHDVDNSCPKFILDGLCESGFIVDDDSEHLTQLTLRCAVDSNRPRTEIVVSIDKADKLYENKKEDGDNGQDCGNKE